MSAGPRRSSSWIVAPDQAGQLSDIVSRFAKDARAAITAGRVFVDGRRVVDEGAYVDVGARIEVNPGRAVSEPLTILQARAGLVAVDKPASLPTEPDRQGLASARELLALELGPGLHALSRLDVGVSGVVLFAESREARQHVEGLREQGAYRRLYVGLALGVLGDEGVWSTPVRGRAAETHFRVCARAGGVCLLALTPRTGRSHQLRMHAQQAAAPLLGDRAHGGRRSFALPSGEVLSFERIALHASSIELTDPSGAPFTARAEVPEELAEWWRRLGGEDAAWSLAG